MSVRKGLTLGNMRKWLAMSRKLPLDNESRILQSNERRQLNKNSLSVVPPWFENTTKQTQSLFDLLQGNESTHEAKSTKRKFIVQICKFENTSHRRSPSFNLVPRLIWGAICKKIMWWILSFDFPLFANKQTISLILCK